MPPKKEKQTVPKIRWRALRQVQWSDEFYQEVVEYLQTGFLPPDYDATPQKRFRFKRTFRPLSLDAGNNIVLVLTHASQVRGAFDEELGQQLYEVRLPHEMQVIRNSQRDAFLAKTYSDMITNAYRSADALYQRVAQETLGITRKDVREFLKTVALTQMQMPARQSAVTQPIVTDRPHQQFEMDLADMSEWQSQNKHIHFLLTVVDCFSKFAWVRPLKNKSAPLVAAELQDIILQFGAPEVISSDRGSEFISGDMETLAKRFKIELRHSNSYSPWVQGQIERLNGTLKKSIFRWMADNETKKYVEALPFLVHSYNTTKHSTTKFTPYQIMFKREAATSVLDKVVHANIQQAATRMIEKDLRKTNKSLEPLELGDQVRINLLSLHEERKRTLFKRKTVVNWSKEVYRVADMPSALEFLVEDEAGQVFQDQGQAKRFRRYQLQKVTDFDKLVQTNASLPKQELGFSKGTAAPVEAAHLDSLAPVAQAAAEEKHEDLEKKEEEKDDEKFEKKAEKEAKRIGIKVKPIPVVRSGRKARGTNSRFKHSIMLD